MSVSMSEDNWSKNGGSKETDNIDYCGNKMETESNKGQVVIKTR